MMVNTPHGELAITRRAKAGFSVMRTKRPVGYRRGRVEAGVLVVVEHHKLTSRKASIGGPWCEWVATYDLQGNVVKVE